MIAGAMELDELRESIRAVLTDRVSHEHIRRFIDSTDLYDGALWREAASLGWLALTVPEEFGGLGLGFCAAALLYEELGRRLAPMPALGTLLVIQAVTDAGTSEQKAAWLPELASGATPASLSVIDPKRKAPSARLRRRPDGNLVLSGRASDVLDGASVALWLITARSEDEQALHLVLVRPNEDGVTIQPEPLVDRTRHLASADFHDLTLPGARVLGESALRPAASDALLGHAALALACDALGGADAALELTIEYLRTRVQFGKPIGSFQALKHRCASHKVALEAARATTLDAVHRWARGQGDAAAHASLAKACACDAAAALASDAVQLHGGIGVTWEHPCHLYLKRAKLNEVLFGARAAHEDRAAALLLNPGSAA